MPLNRDLSTTFNRLVGELDYPMLVVTAAAGDERAGCLVGFATQTSIDPARFTVYLSKANRTYRVARSAEALGVHFLAKGDEDLAELFGGQTGDDVDKFAQVEFHEAVVGVPMLERCPHRFAG